ncbi:hypothetical protein [Paenibacillus lactis]|uniref:hypothetical protein n=1 Tax=Paenibacillus lactis TaxID=228574 RepID=UPI001AFFB9C6|nr:hypothetical protein [Paenibacillus lactis]GIO90897.1 hypothetical protein J31TS3_21240 [Paenibacillus lactis]
MSWMELSSGMDISADIRQSVLRLLASIAIEEMALAHIINAEAEKMQYIAGTLHPGSNPPGDLSFPDYMAVQASARSLMEEVTMLEMMLQMKFNQIAALLKD